MAANYAEINRVLGKLEEYFQEATPVQIFWKF